MRNRGHRGGVVTALAVPPGHYVLVGPMPLVGPQMTFAKVGPDGAGSLVGIDDQAVLEGLIYADLGTLAAGRYVGVVDAYELQAGGSDGQINATPIGWAMGLVVGPSP